MTFRLYYNGDKVDPAFPPAIPPRPLKVPSERPKESEEGGRKSLVPMTSPTVPMVGTPYAGLASLSAPAVPTTDPLEQRRKILTEVREHLDLLKEFEGIISDEDLAQRKRDLFRALPPAPPPAKDAKRPRLDDTPVGEEAQVV